MLLVLLCEVVTLHVVSRELLLLQVLVLVLVLLLEVVAFVLCLRFCF